MFLIGTQVQTHVVSVSGIELDWMNGMEWVITSESIGDALECLNAPLLNHYMVTYS